MERDGLLGQEKEIEIGEMGTEAQIGVAARIALSLLKLVAHISCPTTN